VSVRIRLVPSSDIATVAQVWNAVDEQAATGTLATSWTWTSTWLRHYGDHVQYQFAVAERGREPIGIALLVLSRRGPRPFPLRSLHLGTAGEPAGHSVSVEYNDLLCAPADRSAVAVALAETIRLLPGWDELGVDGFRPDTARALQARLPFDAREDASWTIRFDPARPVLDGLSASTRRLVRQSSECLEPAEPELAASAEAAADVLAELASLHQRRWVAVGEPGAFASTLRSGFLRDLVAAWQPDGRILLYRLRGREGTLGCVLGFVENGRFLYYQGGMQQFTSNRKRAGLLCHTVFAEDCRRRGLAEYELLAGDAQYKRQLSGGAANPLVWGRYARPSLRGRAVSGARWARSAARERLVRRGA
jgi:CelD/BcsL family acetyltransferase involved in cellulose biosynthesis